MESNVDGTAEDAANMFGENSNGFLDKLSVICAWSNSDATIQEERDEFGDAPDNLNAPVGGNLVPTLVEPSKEASLTSEVTNKLYEYGVKLTNYGRAMIPVMDGGIQSEEVAGVDEKEEDRVRLFKQDTPKQHISSTFGALLNVNREQLCKETCQEELRKLRSLGNTLQTELTHREHLAMLESRCRKALKSSRQYRQLVNSNKKLKVRLKKAKTAYNKLGARFAAFQTSGKAQMESSRDREDDLNRRIDGLTKELEIAKKALEEKASQIEVTVASESAGKPANEELLEEKASQIEVTVLGQIEDFLKLRIESLAEELKAANKTFDEYEAFVLETKEEKSADVKALQDMIDQLKTKNEESEEQRIKLMAKVSILQKKLNKINELRDDAKPSVPVVRTIREEEDNNKSVDVPKVQEEPQIQATSRALVLKSRDTVSIADFNKSENEQELVLAQPQQTALDNISMLIPKLKQPNSLQPQLAVENNLKDCLFSRKSQRVFMMVSKMHDATQVNFGAISKYYQRSWGWELYLHRCLHVYMARHKPDMTNDTEIVLSQSLIIACSQQQASTGLTFNRRIQVVMLLLLAWGANRYAYECEAFICAARSSHTRALQILLEEKRDDEPFIDIIIFLTAQGGLAIFESTWYGRVDVVHFLLDRLPFQVEGVDASLWDEEAKSLEYLVACYGPYFLVTFSIICKATAIATQSTLDSIRNSSLLSRLIELLSTYGRIVFEYLVSAIASLSTTSLAYLPQGLTQEPTKALEAPPMMPQPPSALDAMVPQFSFPNAPEHSQSLKLW
ncbi:hypothetical protein HDU76_011050 [Blyttiomyces sp. JEL0837]|nr:hypothetical protein HDU76_011050 [Blyttiomyces sp. JEL0837]